MTTLLTSQSSFRLSFFLFLDYRTHHQVHENAILSLKMHAGNMLTTAQHSTAQTMDLQCQERSRQNFQVLLVVHRGAV